MRSLRFAVLLAFLALAAREAPAAWSTADPADTPLVTRATVSTYEWTTAVNSGTLDVSACDEVQVAFDPSTGDTSTDATIQWRACDAASQNAGSCLPLNWSAPATEATYQKLSVPKRYLQAVALTATAGGDTAQALVKCIENEEDGSGLAGLVECADALYISTGPDGNVGVNILDDGGDNKSVFSWLSAETLEEADPLGVWAKDTNVASWIYSGATTITVRLRFMPLVSVDITTGQYQLVSASHNEGAVADTDGTANGVVVSSDANTSLVVVDELTVDAGDGIGIVAKMLNDIGYIDITNKAVVAEIEQVDPPCYTDR